MFSSTEPSVSSVMGAQRGLGTRLGRPVRCSSAMRCGCSSWAPWAPSLHQGVNLILSYLCIYLEYLYRLAQWLSSWAPKVPSLHKGVNLILSYLFIYVFIWNIYTGWLSSALKWV